MKLIPLIFLVLHQCSGASIPDLMCPEPCICRVEDDSIELSCSSYEFIKKLTPKQITTIVSLYMNDSSLINVDAKLKYLKNLNQLDLSKNAITRLPSEFPYLPKLKSLNLSRNHLKDVRLFELPKNLQTLDLSHNSIVRFPKDWTNLKQLQNLYLFNNPIDCDCHNLFIYEKIKTAGVHMPGNLTCHQPKEFQGRSLDGVNCSVITDNLLNSMLGDEGGSGDVDLIDGDNVSKVGYDQEEFITATDTQSIANDSVGEEGSGDEEGSGYGIPILPIQPRACVFNCSTPKPVGADDELNASPLPPLKEQFGIVVDDIFGNNDGSTTTTELQVKSESESQPITEPTTKPTIVKEAEVEEPVLVKEFDKSQVETFPTNDTVIGEMERASLTDSSPQTMYIIIGLVSAFIVFMIIYLVQKRRKSGRSDKRRRNKSNENGYGEEMKTLEKTAEKQPLNEKPSSDKSPIAENTPLLNSQNGKITDDNDIVKPSIVEENGIKEPEVEVRKLTKEELLTPQLERVTIKSGELPDSIPKTPLLVHRQLNNDGEIVTTVISK